MSSTAVYCLICEPFDPGDAAECFVELKTRLGLSSLASRMVAVQCDVVIVRTEEPWKATESPAVSTIISSLNRL